MFSASLQSLYCKNEAYWKPATMRIAYSGIKFFYATTMRRGVTERCRPTRTGF